MPNEIEEYKKKLATLNEYSSMLINGNYEKDYILGKIEMWSQAVNEQAKFVYRYKEKLKKEQNA